MINRSAAQVAASQANGAQSLGPVTDEGKARAARNSVRHGLCAKEFRLETVGEQAAFDKRLEELIFTYQAVTDLQRDACRHLAVANWRRGVIDNLEAALMQAIAAGKACALHGGDGLPGLGTLARYRARIARDRQEALAELEELKRQRVAAFQAKIAKAKEFSSLDLLGSLKADLGESGFAMFRSSVTNEPKASTQAPAGEPPAAVKSQAEQSVAGKTDRPGRRRAQKLARKQKQRK